MILASALLFALSLQEPPTAPAAKTLIAFGVGVRNIKAGDHVM